MTRAAGSHRIADRDRAEPVLVGHVGFRLSSFSKSLGSRMRLSRVAPGCTTGWSLAEVTAARATAHRGVSQDSRGVDGRLS